MSRLGDPRADRAGEPRRSSNPRAQGAGAVPTDRGFTLIEVVVAIGLVGLLVAVVLPAVVLGIRSNAIGTTNTQARGLAQAEMERMRNLPFHISRNAGEFVDVLDYYFPHTTPAPAVTCRDGDRWTIPTAAAWRGYVAGESVTARCGWEPEEGPFFRQVRTVGRFTVVTATQFLTNATPPVPVTPASGYRNTGTNVAPGQDSPPALQVAARVTVFANDLGTREPVSSATQIGRRDLTFTRVSSSVDVTALEIGTTTRDGLPLTLAVGSVDLGAEVTTTSEARATLASALTGLGTGQQAGGARLSTEAPTDGPRAETNETAGSLDATQGCDLACWGNTSQSGGLLATADGLPNVGSATSPVTATLGNGTENGLGLGQGRGTTYRTELRLLGQLVRLERGPGLKAGVSTTCTPTETGNVVRVRAGGWLTTTDPGPTNNGLVQACGAARADTVSLLPTAFAPDGVLQVRLENARAFCTVSGPARTPAAVASYRAVVERWDGSGYSPLAIISSSGLQSGDPVVPTSLDGLTLSSYSLGPDNGTLADYIGSWSSIGPTDLVQSATGNRARVSVPGVVRINTVPLRPGSAEPTASPTPSPSTSPSPSPTTAPDPLSTLTVSLGSLACSTEDLR